MAGEEATVANSADNMLALCRSCHAETEHAETWDLTEQLGWRIPKWVPEPGEIPALIHTVNGYAWWLLMKDGGYTWMDLSADHRLSWGQP